MEKKNQKKQGKDGALLLVSILVATVLLICFATMMFIKLASDNIKKGEKSGTDILTAQENGLENDGSGSEDMLLQLEEVQTYLETLESEVSDSTLKLNTLVAKEDDNTDKTTEEKESLDSVRQVLNRLNEINENLQQTRNELSEIVNNINQGDKISSKEFLESINNLYSKLEEIDAETNNTLNKIKMIGADNTDEILSAFRDFENRLKKKDAGEEDKYDALLEKVSEKLKETEKILTEDSKKNAETVKNSLEQVFGYVANGKKVIASALATVGRNIDSDAHYEFSELSDLVEHSQDIEGTFVDNDMSEKLLAGATEDNLPLGVAAWVEGRYVVGNGKDITAAYERGYKEGYNKGFADGMNKVLEGLRVEYVYHVHQGNPSECGGCYTTPVYHQHVDASGNIRAENYHASKSGGCFTHKVTTTTSCDCKRKGHEVTALLVTWVTPNYYSDYCNTCNHSCGTTTKQYYTCNCGLSEDVTGYALSCNKSEESLESVTIYFEDEPVLSPEDEPENLPQPEDEDILPTEDDYPNLNESPSDENLPDESLPDENLPDENLPGGEEAKKEDNTGSGSPEEHMSDESNDDTDDEPDDEPDGDIGDKPDNESGDLSDDQTESPPEQSK